MSESIKKDCISSRIKATLIMILLNAAFFLAVLSGTQLIKEASAIPYTQYTDTLHRSDWVLRIPDPWNGMLVILCWGYGGPTWKYVPSNFLTHDSSNLESRVQ